MNKKVLAAFLCVCMVIVTGSLPVSAAKTKKTYKIAIDADIRERETARQNRSGRVRRCVNPK